MSRFEAPTINEIVFNRQDRIRCHKDDPVIRRFSKFQLNEKVAFEFNGMTKYGSITNIYHCGPMIIYSIVTSTGGWFREIEESDIKHITQAL